MNVTLVFTEFDTCGDGPEDAVWNKFMGDGAKTKIRSLTDLLKLVTTQCEAQTEVSEFNEILKDKKQLQAIYTVLNAWHKTGGGAADSFLVSFSEEYVFSHCVTYAQSTFCLFGPILETCFASWKLVLSVRSHLGNMEKCFDPMQTLSRCRSTLHYRPK